MIGKKINQLATELAPTTTDLTIIGDPVTGVSKKITLEQLGAIFGGAVSFYTTLGDFPVTGVIDIIYCAKDTKKLYLWSGSAYVEVFPSQSLLDTYQLRSEKGVSNGYASLDVNGKVPIGQLPNSIMEYKGTWNAATNTPTLANGTGDTGDVYICSVAGTVNFGAGPITFAVGDYVVYSGTIWQRSSGAVGTVTSVAVSRSGDALAITGSPITTSGTINIGFAGTGAQYIKGDGTLATFPSIISQAQNLITEVYNNTGATLTKGTIVYINGGQGNLPTVTKALATSDATSAQTYGVVQTDITNMNNGYVVVEGRLSDLDTQAYANGTQLYLSPTTAGTWTSTKPYAPNHLVYVGIVVRAHPTQGVVEVKIMNGFEMDELHNVAAQSPDNNDILQYKTATSLWTKVAGTTSNIAEGSNLYYTDARSRAALSFTAGSGAYNSTTGVITIPTNTNQLTNGAAYITLTSLAAGAGISYNNTTGVIASTITQYTDALARAAISLTTTGTSGAATYNNTTGVLNIPQYQTALTNPVTGTGTTNYLPKFTGASTIGNSLLTDDGTTLSYGNNIVTIGASNTSEKYLQINSSTGILYLGGTSGEHYVYGAGNKPINFYTNGTSKMLLNASGNLGLGVTPSAWSGTDVRAFDISLRGSISAGGSDVSVVNNAYYNGSSWIYKATGNASFFQQVSGEYKWFQAPSGTAGNAISFTQAMTLNASGNLSIGNTNDTYKLDVSGIIYTQNQISGYLAGQSGLRTYSKSPQFAISSYQSVVGGGFTKTTDIVANADSGADSEIRFLTATTSSNPTTRLTIASTGAATFSSTITQLGEQLLVSNAGSPNIQLRKSGVTDWGSMTYTGSLLQLGTFAGGQTLNITTSGNVGIGTTSPNSLASTTNLIVRGVGSSSTALIQSLSADAGCSVALYSGASSSDDPAILFQKNLRFGSVTDVGLGGFTERMRITSGGVVLVNQTGLSSASAGQRMQIATDVLSTGSFAGYFFENRSGGVTSNSNWAGWYYSGTTIRMYNGSADIFSMSASTGASTFSGDVKVKTLEVTNVGTDSTSSGVSTYMQITVNGNPYLIPLHGTP